MNTVVGSAHRNHAKNEDDPHQSGKEAQPRSYFQKSDHEAVVKSDVSASSSTRMT